VRYGLGRSHMGPRTRDVLLPLQGFLFPPLMPTETVLMGLLCPGAQERVWCTLGMLIVLVQVMHRVYVVYRITMFVSGHVTSCFPRFRYCRLELCLISMLAASQQAPPIAGH